MPQRKRQSAFHFTQVPKKNETQAERQKRKKERKKERFSPHSSFTRAPHPPLRLPPLNICPSVTSPLQNCSTQKPPRLSTRTHTHTRTEEAMKASLWSGSVFENNGNFTTTRLPLICREGGGTRRQGIGEEGDTMGKGVSAGKSLQRRKMRRELEYLLPLRP